MWVYDQERQRNLWANAAALSFWRADSAEEFLSRDLSDMSPSVAERLAVTAADHAHGEGRYCRSAASGNMPSGENMSDTSRDRSTASAALKRAMVRATWPTTVRTTNG